MSISIAGTIALLLVTTIVDAWWLRMAILGGVLLLGGCVLVFPRQLAPPRAPEELTNVQGLSAKDRIQFADDRRKLQNDIRTTLLQTFTGGAVLLGLLFTWQQQHATNRQIADQLNVTRQGQIGERFSRGVGQLASNSIDVRLGGLYELEQLARQAPDRRLVVMEVVAAYVRQHARSAATPKVGPLPAVMPTAGPLPQDVAAAVTILGRRSIQDGDPQVNLRRARLGNTDLTLVTLRDADLSGADFRGADLGGADLSRARLLDAKLGGADLTSIKLSGADLAFMNLRSAELEAADLRSADLASVDLRGARLLHANLGGANLEVADLRHANLGAVNLAGANLFGADLRGADLGSSNLFEGHPGADLRGADLRSADLRDANLHGANLVDAQANKFTRWPINFKWQQAGVVVR